MLQIVFIATNLTVIYTRYQGMKKFSLVTCFKIKNKISKSQNNLTAHPSPRSHPPKQNFPSFFRVFWFNLQDVILWGISWKSPPKIDREYGFKHITLQHRSHQQISLFNFLKIFGGHESFLWGHWYPCFGLLVTSPVIVRARVGSALFELSRVIRVTLHVPSDSPLLTSWRPAWQPSHLLDIPARHWQCL